MLLLRYSFLSWALTRLFRISKDGLKKTSFPMFIFMFSFRQCSAVQRHRIWLTGIIAGSVHSCSCGGAHRLRSKRSRIFSRRVSASVGVSASFGGETGERLWRKPLVWAWAKKRVWECWVSVNGSENKHPAKWSKSELKYDYAYSWGT